MPSSLSSEPPLTDLDELEARTERLLLGRLGPDWRDEVWRRHQQDLAWWGYENDERESGVAAAVRRAGIDAFPRSPPRSIALRHGHFVAHTIFHDNTSDYDLEAQRRPRNDPANSRRVHPWWWPQNFHRYEPRLPLLDEPEVAYDTRGGEYHLFQHDTVRPDFIPMSPGEESEVETVIGPTTAALFATPVTDAGAGQGWPPQEGEAAYRARLRAENWHHFKQQFSSFGGAFRFIGRMLLRILFGIVWSVRGRAG